MTETPTLSETDSCKYLVCTAHQLSEGRPHVCASLAIAMLALTSCETRLRSRGPSKASQLWALQGLMPAVSIPASSLQSYSLWPLCQTDKKRQFMSWHWDLGGRNRCHRHFQYMQERSATGKWLWAVWISQTQLKGPLHPIANLLGQKVMNMEMQSKVPTASLHSADVPRSGGNAVRDISVISKRIYKQIIYLAVHLSGAVDKWLCTLQCWAISIYLHIYGFIIAGSYSI